MKDILLDTHVFLWMQNAPEKLSDNLIEKLNRGDMRWHLSQISVWEIQIKYDLGKLSIPSEPSAWLPELIEESGLAYQPLQDDAIFMLGKLQQIHRDPFDRLLVATSIINGWVIATFDEQIRSYPVQTIS